MKILLTRSRSLSNDKCTQGVIEVGTDLSLFTMELPDKNNAKRISCVPVGVYDLIRYASPKFGSVYGLVNERLGVSLSNMSAQRTHILIHAANTASELLGCIAPGFSRDILSGQPAVLQSKAALARFMRELDRVASPKLIIEWGP